MPSLELLVGLKIPDVTALTAAGALRRRMGYQDTLGSLKRADYYRLDLAGPGEQAALDLGKELAENTNLFVNPNKHVYELRACTHEPLADKSGRQVVQVLITDPADGSAEGLRAALRGRLGYEGRVTGLLRGVLWTLELQSPSHEEAKQVAEQIAVTRTRSQGLLMNPHFQECEIW